MLLHCVKRLYFPLLLIAAASIALAQTGGTGAISGTITDQAGASVPAAQVKVVNTQSAETRTVQTSQSGVFTVPLLPPGIYRVDVTKSGFKTVTFKDVHVEVTETVGLNARMEVGALTEQITVESAAEQLQTESSALGRVTTGEMVAELPLVARNFTQIIGLNAGVAAGVTNAADLGRGNGGTTAAPFVAQGGTASDNNFQMDGLSANDIQSSGQFSGGAAIPNPDTIQEFKVQTAMYDASFGRNAGANVNVVTKSGTNQFHGSAWEFLRNEDLNANSFFSNQAGQPRPLLRQNQYGFTAGGPAIKDKLMMFGSYQGTKQLNGVSSTCSSNFRMPPLTNDRSRAALGALFAGQRGFAQGLAGNVGPAIAADGSNISPQAFALLNLKFPNGQYVVPSAQAIDRSQPFAAQGVVAISDPCTFSENQFMVNGDFYQSQRSKFAARYFQAKSDQTTTLPATNIGGPTAPGWPVLNPQLFINASLTHTYTFTPSLLNELQMGYHRQHSTTLQSEPINFSDFGSNVPSYDNNIPAISLNGMFSLGGNGQTVDLFLNTYVLQDTLSWNRGKHSVRLGGGISKSIDAFEHFHYIAGLIFLSFPDFLLGLDANKLGTAAAGLPIGNVYASVDLQGLFDRNWQVWESNYFVQDDYKVSRRLTLNLGMRFERLGNITDTLGRGANLFYPAANPTPPATGTYQGFVVPNNFQGTPPSGVQRLSTNSGFLDQGMNTWNPRLGFAYQIPGMGDRLVLRGGYGMYHSRTTGQVLLQLVTAPPFSYLNSLSATANAAASWAKPFPDPVQMPSFPLITPNTRIGLTVVAPDFRPPTIHRANLGMQVRVPGAMVLDVGYVGARDLHLIRGRSVNQAYLASPSNPIRGVTTNTLANVYSRVPYQGFTSNSFNVLETNAAAWYHALNVTLSKRYSYGLQFQAAYTWSRYLGTDSAISNGSTGSSAVGDQYSPSQRYGPDSFNRDQRFVFNGVYSIPGPKMPYLANFLLGGWQMAVVGTVQSGQHLTATYTNASSVYGTTNDRAQLVAGCAGSQLVNPGSPSANVGRYINTSCFTAPLVVGDDGKALGFGNSGVGIITGPGQVNFDFSMIKQWQVKTLGEKATVQFRPEFFNVFNHPNFGNPTLNQTSATFGRILSTNVNPRVIQFGLKLAF